MKTKYYVYHLIDPRDGSVFYVGKGTGDRINYHGTAGDKINARKLARIRDIEDAGLEVERQIVSRHTSEKAAYKEEAQQISELPDLTNDQQGRAVSYVKHGDIAHKFRVALKESGIIPKMLRDLDMDNGTAASLATFQIMYPA